MPVITERSEDFLKATGSAVQAYAGVESSQARLLESIFNIDSQQARIVFFAIQSVHARNDIFHALLEHKYGNKYEKFWNSCGDFLETLAKFRNAIIHWHPLTIMYVNRSGDPSKTPKPPEPALHNPRPGRSQRSLTLDDFPLFTRDCLYIRSELDQFSEYLKFPNAEEAAASEEKFLKGIDGKNRALLRAQQVVKAQKPRIRHLAFEFRAGFPTRKIPLDTVCSRTTFHVSHPIRGASLERSFDVGWVAVAAGRA